MANPGNQAASAFVVPSSVAVVVAAPPVSPLVEVSSPPGEVAESQAVSTFVVSSSAGVVGTPAASTRTIPRTNLRNFEAIPRRSW
jgi:hypothetical protein